MNTKLQRINFFRGLFMQAEDWQKAQLYHLQKQRFHNQCLHDPGIAPGCLDDFLITAANDGSKLTISPGFAIDGDGNDLFLPEPRVLVPSLDSFNLPAILYITLRYTEYETDQRTDEANPAYSGCAFIEEDVVIELSAQEPDNKTRLELARVQLSQEPYFIKNPASTLSPAGPNELDYSHRPSAGAKTPPKSTQLSLSDLGNKILDTTIQVRSGGRKQDDTSVLIETCANSGSAPMYMVHAQSMDGARIQWWIECLCANNSGGSCSEYTLHIKNYADKATTVRCVVYTLRV